MGFYIQLAVHSLGSALTFMFTVFPENYFILFVSVVKHRLGDEV